MVDTLTITPASASLKIGDGAQTISVQVHVENVGQSWLRLRVPVGKDGIFAAVGDAENCEFKLGSTVLGVWGDEPKRNEYVSRQSAVINGSGDHKIEISKILCNTSTMPANIEIIKVVSQNRIETTEKKDLLIQKTIPNDGPEILYFRAEPPYLDGKAEVILSWDFRNPATKAKLQTFKDRGFTEVSKRQYPEELSQNWNYILQALDPENLETILGESDVTVQVHPPGWKRVDPAPLHKKAVPDPFPSVIFDNDGDWTDHLYAILCRPGEAPALCRSSNGITGWAIVERGTPAPKAMASSPGLRLGKRLWLIGGSAVDPDPDQKSNKFYYFDIGGNAGWREATFSGGDFEKRMGHACLRLTDTTFWVLGGFGRYEVLNDVWQFTLNEPKPPSDSVTLSAAKVVEAPGEKWLPRCLFSAVQTKDKSIWVCGGLASPTADARGDIWSAKLAHPPAPLQWQKRPRDPPPKEYVADDAIGMGVVRWQQGVLAVVSQRPGVNSTEDRRLIRGLPDPGRDQDNWGDSLAQSMTLAGCRWESLPHHITATWFKGRLFVRYLHMDAMLSDAEPPGGLYCFTPADRRAAS
jgi:hypothetical protein